MPTDPQKDGIQYSWLEASETDDLQRGWYHWQHDFLRHITGESPSANLLLVFQQLCFWWRKDWHRKFFEQHMVEPGTSKKVRNLDDAEIQCWPTAEQLSSFTLGVVSAKTAHRSITELESMGILTTKRGGPGQPAVRVLNRRLVEGYLERWNTDPKQGRETMIDRKTGELSVRVGKRWVPASLLPILGNLDSQNGKSGSPKMGNLDSQNGKSSNKGDIKENKGEEIVNEGDTTPPCGETPVSQSWMIRRKDGKVYGTILDTITPQEEATIQKLLQDIQDSSLLPFQLPTQGKSPSKLLTGTMEILLHILRKTWNPGLDQPMFYPETHRHFRDTIIEAATHYRKHIELMGGHPKDLHSWIYNNHPDPECRASGLLGEIAKMVKEQEHRPGKDAKALALQNIPTKDHRALELILQNAQDTKPPHPTAFWRMVASWHEFAQERGRDIRFHGILNRGWFRVPTREVSARELLNLYMRYRSFYGLLPTAWIPEVDSDEWKRFSGWLASNVGQEDFVDLNYVSPLSDEERKEHLETALVEEALQSVSLDPKFRFDEDVVRQTLLQHIPDFPMSPRFIHFAEVVMRLARAARTGMGGRDRLKFAKALRYTIQHQPADLDPQEEVHAATFGFKTMLQLHSYWAENDPEVLSNATAGGLFEGVVDHTQTTEEEPDE